MTLSAPAASVVPASARAAAIVTWVYAAAFGLPAIPIAVFVVRERSLPWFLDLFPMYGGPWSAAGRWTVFAWLLVAYFVLTLGVVRVALAAVAWRPTSLRSPRDADRRQ